MVDVPDISIVVPVYGSDSTLVPLYERVASAVAPIPASFELIFVDDRGPGNPWEIISRMARSDPRVIGLKLSRNFGQHSAIMAGIDLARGRWLVIMDCDLQDRPEEIPRLWAEAQKRHDVVIGRRVERQDGFFKRLFSRVFHSVFKYMTDESSDPAQSNFGIYSRKVVDIVKELSEQPRVFLHLVRWAGFDVTPIDIEHGRRDEGKSAYTLRRKLSLAMDIIVSYSNKPLKMCVQFGFFMAFAAFCYGAWIFIRYFLFNYTPAGWTSVMVSLFFLSGVLLFGMGILGIYIGRVFNQVKGRPLYVVDDRTPVFVKDDSL
ncbi:MAG: glycosyltransferase family 2 protein [Deltaproteobacteria bacterium]|nr:glycosyltransferase family 2 protein [Deltaproteobacteria bacterium]